MKAPQNTLFDLSAAGDDHLSVKVDGFGLSLPIRIEVRSSSVDRWSASRHGNLWKAGSPDVSVTIGVTRSGGGLRFEWTLRNVGSAALQVDSCGFLVDGLNPLWAPSSSGPRGLRLAYCGAHSKSESSRSYVSAVSTNAPLKGWWVGAIAADGGAGIVLGALDFRRFVCSIEMSHGSIMAREILEQMRLEPGESLALSPMWCAVTRTAPLEALEQYASAVGELHGVKLPPSACGWGSWGHFFEQIDADLMRETALAIEGTSSIRTAVNVLQIDDGWAELLDSGRVSAAWRPNDRFPSGIAPLASVISQCERVCGLWILPFTANPGSALAEEHPEFFVKDQAGSPLRLENGDSYCLDPTHPGAREWLKGLLAQVREWGVQYIKLDFLRALLAPEPNAELDGVWTPRQFHVPLTRAEAYRVGLELVREAVGPEVFIVACSAPAGPGAGLVDAHRVGPDIDSVWTSHASGVRDAAQSVAANYFWHGRSWLNDPDYLLPCESVEATRFWATVVAMSGGSAILSADMGELPNWQEEIFSFVMPPLGIAARPLDLFTGDPGPALWRLDLNRDGKEWHMVAVFNWSDMPRDVALQLTEVGLSGKHHVWNSWRCSHSLAENRLNLNVEAQDVALLRLTPAAAYPMVIGTDIHFGQGMLEIEREYWDEETQTLDLVASLNAGSGNFFVSYPSHLRPNTEDLAVVSERVIRVPVRPGSSRTISFVHKEKVTER